MPAYLLAWNPSRWSWNDLPDVAEKVRRGEECRETWSVRNKGIKPGDRLFLMRQGQEPKGIVASGRALSTPHLDAHWDPSKAEAGVQTLRIDVLFDTIRDPATDRILPRSQLKSGILAEGPWDTQASGVEIPPSVWVELEKQWAALTARKVPDAQMNETKTLASSQYASLVASFKFIFDNYPSAAMKTPSWPPISQALQKIAGILGTLSPVSSREHI